MNHDRDTSLIPVGSTFVELFFSMGAIAKMGGLSMQAAKWLRPFAERAVFAGRIELMPPSPADIPAIIKGMQGLVRSARTGAWTQLTVREATINAVVAGEIFIWFFIGEVIGKGSVFGYQV